MNNLTALRNPSKVSLFIDNCVWDFFFKKQFDLAIELPAEEFDLLMTNLVHDFEVEGFLYQKEKYSYVQEQIINRGIKTDSYFGFASYEDDPQKKYKVSGFGKGRYISYNEIKEYMKYEHYINSANTKRSGLYANEADVWLAVLATTGHIVLTNEKKKRKKRNGPLQKAYEDGGKIIFLEDFNQGRESIKQFIFRYITNLKK